jgi:hypothetical protein
MPNPKKIFKLQITSECPSVTIDLVCIAYLHYDGTLRTVDINEALFNGKDVADYVSAAQSDVWDEWLEKAEDHFRAENEEPAPVEHD